MVRIHIYVYAAIAKFSASGIFGWYSLVVMARRVARTTWYQPKLLVGMISAIAELNANELCDRRIDGNKYYFYT